MEKNTSTMTNTELIAKIKAEIERRITDNTFGAKLELIDILAWLDSIESENPVPTDLEEAAKNYALNTAEDSEQYSARYLGYKDGAKWQKEQDEKELSEKIASAYQLGLADKEKQMLKEAVNGFIFQSADYYPKQLIAGYDGELGMGDKVRIIVLPNED